MTTSYWDGSTEAGTKYSYEILAYNSTGDSSATASNTITTPDSATAAYASVNS